MAPKAGSRAVTSDWGLWSHPSLSAGATVRRTLTMPFVSGAGAQQQSAEPLTELPVAACRSTSELPVSRPLSASEAFNTLGTYFHSLEMSDMRAEGNWSLIDSQPSRSFMWLGFNTNIWNCRTLLRRHIVHVKHRRSSFYHVALVWFGKAGALWPWREDSHLNKVYKQTCFWKLSPVGYTFRNIRKVT